MSLYEGLVVGFVRIGVVVMSLSEGLRVGFIGLGISNVMI